MGRGKFFQIDRRVWARVCSLGLNPAVAYLVLASGTGADNRSTAWSVHAIERYTSMGRGRAKRAVNALLNNNLITRDPSPQSRPRYSLPPASQLLEIQSDELEAEWIWLPNSIITGVASEVPPIDRLRALHDVRLLQGFVELYAQQALADDGGIPSSLVAEVYKRRCITERGYWCIWGFNPEQTRFGPDFAAARRWREGQPSTPHDRDFLPVWRELLATGLFECVPHLIEADTEDAAVLFPCPGADCHDGTDVEKILGAAVREAAEAMIGEEVSPRLEDWELVVPVQSRFPKVAVVGIYRLRYRARTRAAAAWVARQEENLSIADRYRQLGKCAELGQPLTLRSA